MSVTHEPWINDHERDRNFLDPEPGSFLTVQAAHVANASCPCKAAPPHARSAIEFSRCCDLYFAVVFAGGYAISFLTRPLTRHLPQKLITLFPS